MNERGVEIGNRIARARRDAEITQRELAAILDVSERSIQDYERGLRVPWEHLDRLEQLFDLPLAYFVHGIQAGAVGPDPDLAARRHDEIVSRLDQLAESVRVLTAGLPADRRTS